MVEQPVGDGEVQRRRIEPVQHAHDAGFGFAHVLGQQQAQSAGVTVKVASRPPASA